MRNLIGLIAGLTVALMASTAMGQGQPQCGERDNVRALLAKKYQETTTAGGVTNLGGLIEVLTSPDGETWTIVLTTPQGMSCLVATGEGWRTMTPKSTDPEA